MRIYDTLHPGLLRYLTPDAWARTKAQFVSAMRSSRRRQDAFIALARFTAAIRCGHTYPNFHNQTDGIANALFGGRTRLPIEFLWQREGAVVTAFLGKDASVRPGDLVTHLDGRPMPSVRDALLPLVRGDGSNDIKRLSLLSPTGRDGIETFDVFQGILFPPRKGHVELRLLSPDGKERTTRVEAVDLAARTARLRPGADARSGEPLWTFTLRDGIGVLTMPNWAVYQSRWDWEAFIDDTFEQLKGARGLVIDIRGNEGGNDCGDSIIARLIDADLPRDDSRRLVRASRVPAEFNPWLDTWDDSFRDWGEAARPTGDGWFELARGAEADGLIRPRGPRFTGNVVVLTDAVNSSATFEFAWSMQRHGLGTVCGTATGGNRRGINGGAFFFVRLPETGLEADLPLIGYYPRSQQPDAGLVPDVPVDTTAADIAAGRDPVMQRGLSLAAA